MKIAGGDPHCCNGTNHGTSSHSIYLSVSTLANYSYVNYVQSTHHHICTRPIFIQAPSLLRIRWKVNSSDCISCLPDKLNTLSYLELQSILSSCITWRLRHPHNAIWRPHGGSNTSGIILCPLTLSSIATINSRSWKVEIVVVMSILFLSPTVSRVTSLTDISNKHVIQSYINYRSSKHEQNLVRYRILNTRTPLVCKRANHVRCFRKGIDINCWVMYNRVKISIVCK